MTWVRYDDNVANHPKVAPLDDATYRLWREAIEWCAHNLTDGVILARQLGLTSTRATPARSRKLVDQGLWHTAGETCDSNVCPPSGANGWVIHDYWDYQFTREKIQAEQEAKRERQRKYMEKVRAGRRGASDGTTDDASHRTSADTPDDASDDANPAPPRPAPKGSGEGTSPKHPPPAKRRDGAGGGREDEQPTGRAAPNGQPTKPPDLTEVRAQLAAATTAHRIRDRSRADPLAELRAATPAVPVIEHDTEPSPPEEPT